MQATGFHYEDEYETVIEMRACSCGGLKNCDGHCNGSTSVGSRRRPIEEILRLTEARRRREEDEILSKVDEIRRRRGTAG